MELKKQKTYKTVYEIACDALIASDCAERCANAGLKCTEEQQSATIEIPYFDETIFVHIPQFSFKSSKSANVTLVTKILLLHYINHASGIPFSGEKVNGHSVRASMRHRNIPKMYRAYRSAKSRIASIIEVYTNWRTKGSDEQNGAPVFVAELFMNRYTSLSHTSSRDTVNHPDRKECS